MVTETNEKLITEAGKQQQLIAALEQCVNLKDELQRSNALCEEQVSSSLVNTNMKACKGEKMRSSSLSVKFRFLQILLYIKKLTFIKVDFR